MENSEYICAKFESENSTIYQGDAVEILLNCIPDNSIDLIFADPPYNIGKRFSNFVDHWKTDEDYTEWCKVWLELCIKKLKPHGSLYVMTSTKNMPLFDLFLRTKLTILSRIVWYYDSSGVQAKKYFGSLYEPILHCVVNKDNYTFNASNIMVEAKTGAIRKLIDYRRIVPTIYNSKKVPGNAWYFPRVRYKMEEYVEHPTQKPEALLKRIILASSNQGDTILDPFAGSFTTSKVAQTLNRKSIGIEMQDAYVQIGLKRLDFINKM